MHPKDKFKGRYSFLFLMGFLSGLGIPLSGGRAIAFAIAFVALTVNTLTLPGWRDHEKS